MTRNRLVREGKTIEAMVAIYCRECHHQTDGLCADCRRLSAYALQRIEQCPYGEDKPVCARCPIHCYKPAMREEVRKIMRYAGPRMLLRHPLLTLWHTLDSLSKSGRSKAAGK